jgi:UDP-GlcNAc:undecaprenyl-phosphate/decaprenyl-phosphate GlcNAc-1-phosphate transferase
VTAAGTRLLSCGVGLAAGVTATRLARRFLAAAPPGGAARWERINHRGETVSLLEGPAYVLGSVAGLGITPGVAAPVRAAGMLASLGAGAFGAYDDLAGESGSKGFRGHLAALRRGELTTGIVKIAGIGATGFAASALVSDDLIDWLLGGAVIAATANLVNLFDLRPGRALKVGLVGLMGVVLAPAPSGAIAATPIGAAAASLPEDLAERGMLGDTGANALGAALGVGIAAASTPVVRAAVLGVLVTLTLASEKVSFTKVIEATPALRWIDQLGRRPPAA